MINKLKITAVAVIIIFLLVPSTCIALEVYMPHITGGSHNWSDILQVDNNSVASQTFTLNLYSDGTQIYQNSFSVPGFGEAVINLKQLASTAETGSITYSSAMLNFRLDYRNVSGGGVAEFKLTGEQYPIMGFYFSDFITSINWKGIALANFNSIPATVVLYAVGRGEILGTQKITVPANNKVVGVHTKWFSGIDFRQVKKIIAVSASDLTGITICGDSISSMLLFTPAAEVSDFNPEAVSATDITGTWSGIWRSSDFIGESGSIEVTIVQTGKSFTGTAYLGNTDCGDITDVPINVTVAGNIVTVNGSYNCSGNIATLSLTNGTVADTTMVGSYEQNVNGQYYDAGTFSLIKQ